MNCRCSRIVDKMTQRFGPIRLESMTKVGYEIWLSPRAKHISPISDTEWIFDVIFLTNCHTKLIEKAESFYATQVRLTLWFYKNWALSKQSPPRKEDRRTTRRSAWATFQNLQEQRRNLEDRIHEDDLRDRAEARLHCVVLHLSNRLNYNYVKKNQW